MTSFLRLLGKELDPPCFMPDSRLVWVPMTLISCRTGVVRYYSFQLDSLFSLRASATHLEEESMIWLLFVDSVPLDRDAAGRR